MFNKVLDYIYIYIRKYPTILKGNIYLIFLKGNTYEFFRCSTDKANHMNMVWNTSMQKYCRKIRTLPGNLRKWNGCRV